MERSPAEYGVWFAISSIGYMAGNFGASRLSTRYGIDRMIWWGIGFEALGVVLSAMLAMFAMHWGPVIVFGPQLIVNFGNGLLLPGAISGAVSVRAAGGRHRRRHHRLHADGARRRGHAIRRHAARGIATRRCRWRC